jgi:uncharacterized metal-binding protein
MRGDFPVFRQLYANRQWQEMAYHAALVEAEGYGRWPRIREIGEFSKRVGFRRLGIAHCPDTLREAQLAGSYLATRGLDSILPPEGNCDPEGQARFLEERGTDFNVICGMCGGHDSIFIRSSSHLVPLLGQCVWLTTRGYHGPH